MEKYTFIISNINPIPIRPPPLNNIYNTHSKAADTRCDIFSAITEKFYDNTVKPNILTFAIDSLKVGWANTRVPVDFVYASSSIDARNTGAFID